VTLANRSPRATLVAARMSSGTDPNGFEARVRSAAPGDALDRDVVLARVRAGLIDPGTPPVRIGRFEITERLGSGGMGVVYAAYDRELDRKVAIKLLHESVGVDDRLRHEAQVLARLRHPNVVGVYEVGVDAGGRRFVAMELVEGTDLAAWLAVGRRDARTIVDVFVAAARGLAAAHAADVIHADFKPANVLVADVGSGVLDVRVADFGLARRGRGDHTAGVGWTHAYVAPEVATGAMPTAAADQYAFAIGLREALTLADPKPSRRDARALAACIERACRSDPADRWPSVATMADTMHAIVHRRRRAPLFAAAVPVAFAGLAAMARPRDLACEPSVGDVWHQDGAAGVMQAFGRLEHPAARVTAVFVVERMNASADAILERRAALCEASSGIDVSTDDALVRRHRCLTEAEERFAGAAEALLEIDEDSFERATSWLPDASAVVMCDDHAALLGEVALPPEKQAAVDEIVRMTNEASRRTMAGDPITARDTLRAAADKARVVDHPPTTARVLVALARATTRTGDPVALVPLLREAVLEAERGRADYTREAALSNLAYALSDEGDFEEARDADARALAVAERLLAKGPDAEIIAAARRATIEGASKGPEAALAYRQRALALFRASPHLGSELEADLLSGLASVELDLMRISDARGHYEAALAILEPILGRDHPDLGALLIALAACDIRDGRLESGERALSRVVEIRSLVMAPDDPRLAAPLVNLGAARFGLGDFAGALDVFERALAIRTKQWGPDHIELAKVLTNLSFCQGRLGRHAEALASAQRALAIRVAAIGPDHPDTGKAHHAVAIAARRNDDRTRAEAEFRAAIAIARRTPDVPELYEPLTGLADVLLEADRKTEVEALLEPEVAGCRAGDGSRTICAALELDLAQAIVEKRRAEAIRLAQQVREGLRDVEGGDELRAKVDAWLATHAP